MIIYLDILVFLNLVINYSFIKLIYLLFNEKINILRVVLSLLFSILILFTFLLNYIIYNIIKIVGGILIILIAFKFSNKKRLIIMSTMFYIMQFSFIGVLNIFNIKGYMCLVLLMLVCLLIIISYKKSHIYNKKTYKVIIKINNKEVNIEGFVDTGNMASYYNKPIVFLDYKYYQNNLKVDCVVPIKTVSDIKYINCYKVDKFYILENNVRIEKDVLIAFTTFDNNISCLLNNLLFI